jgi:ADP-ribose pyrophosphatase
MTAPPEELLVTRRFRVVRHHLKGRDGLPHPKETVEHPGAVAILPLVDDDHVCLIRNYRVAVDKTLIELPAGTIERLREFTMSPGILNERMHLYLARNLTAGEMALEAGEEIETLVVAWDEALRMVFDGSIEDAKTLVGLMHYDYLRRQLPRR